VRATLNTIKQGYVKLTSIRSALWEICQAHNPLVITRLCYYSNLLPSEHEGSFGPCKGALPKRIKPHCIKKQHYSQNSHYISTMNLHTYREYTSQTRTINLAKSNRTPIHKKQPALSPYLSPTDDGGSLQTTPLSPSSSKTPSKPRLCAKTFRNLHPPDSKCEALGLGFRLRCFFT